MKTTELILIISAFAFAGVRLYMKYVKKKNEGDLSAGSKPQTGAFSSPWPTGDDYEPYSKK